MGPSSAQIRSMRSLCQWLWSGQLLDAAEVCHDLVRRLLLSVLLMQHTELSCPLKGRVLNCLSKMASPWLTAAANTAKSIKICLLLSLKHQCSTHSRQPCNRRLTANTALVAVCMTTVAVHNLIQQEERNEKKTKLMPMPFGVNVMRNHILYRAAQAQQVETQAVTCARCCCSGC